MFPIGSQTTLRKKHQPPIPKYSSPTSYNAGTIHFGIKHIKSYPLQRNKVKQATIWHKIAVWGNLATLCEEMVKKGKFLKIEGKINYRQYENKAGQKVYLTEIQAHKIEEVKTNFS